jgi:hypothetical protein
VLAAWLPVAGCVSLGWRFGPGFSATDTSLFAKPPVVVHRGRDFFLAWTQGSSPFFFEPAYQARDGRLVFALVSTSSSANLAGRPREMRLQGDANLAALQRGGGAREEQRGNRQRERGESTDRRHLGGLLCFQKEAGK